MTLVEKAQMFRKLIKKASQSLEDADVLSMPDILPRQDRLVEEKYTVLEEQVPFKFQYNGLPYKCIKSGQNFQAQWVPGPDTASIFVRISLETEDGTLENPIVAARGMEYIYGKYYKDPEDSNIYICKRGEESGSIVLNYLPHELVRQYFEAIHT